MRVIASAIEQRRARNHREALIQTKEKRNHSSILCFLLFFLVSLFFLWVPYNPIFGYAHSLFRETPLMSLCNLNFGRLS